MKKGLKITIELELRRQNGQITDRMIDEFYKNMEFGFPYTYGMEIADKPIKPVVEVIDIDDSDETDEHEPETKQCCIYEKQWLCFVKSRSLTENPDDERPLYSVHLFGHWYLKYNNKNYKVL